MTAVLATIGAAVVAFVLSGTYYTVFASAPARSSVGDAEPDRSMTTTVVVELARNVVLAVVIAQLVSRLSPGFGGVLILAIGLWVAFPVVLLAGSVFHERVPVRSAVVHAGDWFIKLLAITSVVWIAF